jgi:hypothetical protein
MRRQVLAWVAQVVGAVALGGCSTAPADARITLALPFSSEDAFGPVANYLERRCGSLDCHGNVARNLRIYGCGGLRLLPTDVPLCMPPLGATTTMAEHQATYRSLVGLEPLVMSAVVLDHGLDPELLTFVRKARGEEAHKGGTLIVQGDHQDRCITSWLAGATDTTACDLALSEPNFPVLMPNQ